MPLLYQVVEGKTPEITVAQARQLLQSVETSTAVGLRDQAILAILIYTPRLRERS